MHQILLAYQCDMVLYKKCLEKCFLIEVAQYRVFFSYIYVLYKTKLIQLFFQLYI